MHMNYICIYTHIHTSNDSNNSITNLAARRPASSRSAEQPRAKCSQHQVFWASMLLVWLRNHNTTTNNNNNSNSNNNDNDNSSNTCSCYNCYYYDYDYDY